MPTWRDLVTLIPNYAGNSLPKHNPGGLTKYGYITIDVAPLDNVLLVALFHIIQLSNTMNIMMNGIPTENVRFDYAQIAITDVNMSTQSPYCSGYLLNDFTAGGSFEFHKGNRVYVTDVSYTGYYCIAIELK